MWAFMCLLHVIVGICKGLNKVDTSYRKKGGHFRIEDLNHPANFVLQLDKYIAGILKVS